jgi:RHS repeat-associated protein
MSSNVTKRNIAHKGSGHGCVAPAAMSLVTPPAPPVPTPFPYTARAANASDTKKHLKVAGKEVLVDGSTMSLDPPANQPAQSGGGDVVTHATKNIAVMTMGSPVLTAGGKGVCATGDMAAMNVITKQSKVAQMTMPLLEAADFEMASKSRAAAAAMNRRYRRAYPPVKANQCPGGHPVDLGTGYVIDDAVDLRLPGFLPLNWTRSYNSAAASHRGALGKGGWTHRFEQWIEPIESGFRYHDEEGLPVDLGPIAPDGVSFHRGRRLELRRAGQGFELRSLDTRWVRTFAPLPGGRCALRSIQDSRLHHVDLEYDGDLLVRIVDSVRREIRIVNDAKGRVTRVEVWASEPGDDQPPALRTWFDYAYHTEGELASHTDALGHAEGWEYDGLHRMIKATLRNGVSFYYQYDPESGHCVRTWGDGGLHDVRIEIDFEKGETVTHGTNRARRYLWNNGVVYREETFGGEWAVERIYDDDEILVARKNGAGEETVYEHDARGNLIKETDAAGNVQTWEYVDDLCVRHVDGAGLETRYVHDHHGWMVGITLPGGFTYQMELNREGQLAAIHGKEGLYRRFEHDAHNNLCAEVTSRGARRAYRFDALGRPYEQVDAIGRRYLVSYDEVGQVREIHRPDGTKLLATYDRLGKIATATDALGNVSRAEHGGTGHLARLVQPDGQIFRFLYDSDERLIQILNPRLEKYELEYDRADQIVVERPFDGRLISYQYDRAGRVTRVDHPENEWREYQYDKLGQVVEDRGDDVTITFARDPLGRIEKAVSQDVTGKVVNEIERDHLGRVTADICNGRAVRFEYDSEGRRAARVTPSGDRTEYHYDEEDDCVGVTHQGKRVAIDRDRLGRERSRRAEGWRLDSEYDTMDRLASQRVSTGDKGAPAGAAAAARLVAERRYGYDSKGRLTSIDSTPGRQTVYRYDRIDQLVEARRGSIFEVFEYDPTGSLVNIGHDVGALAGKPAWSMARGNVLLATPEARYVNDDRRRRIQRIEPGEDGTDRVTTYGWDTKGRLREVVLPDGSRVRFIYDALGRRVRKDVLPAPPDVSAILSAAPPRGLANKKVLFAWDGDVLCEEVEPDKPDRRRVHVHEPGTFIPMLQIEAGQVLGVITDHLGTPKELVDERGRVAWRAEHRAWGSVVSATRDPGTAEVESPFRLLGQYADEETGLCYTRHRYFEPDTGRWLSPDPLGIFGGKNLSGFNGAPSDSVDPLGLTCHKDTNKGLGYVIYHIKKNGKVVYVGITEADRFNDRKKEHTRSGRLQPGMDMEIADTAKTYGDARGYEQAHIEFYGTRNTSAAGTPYSTNPANRCWSWDPARANDPSDVRAQAFNQAYLQKSQQLWGTVMAY